MKTNPPQPDITRTIEEILDTYQSVNQGNMYRKDEAVHKLVTLYQDGMADGYKTGYIKGQLEAREDMRELSQ